MAEGTKPTLRQERTFMLIKADGVKRGLVGECIKRVEQRGLKIIAVKMIQADEEMALAHHPSSEEWLKTIGEKTETTYKEYGHDMAKGLGTDDHVEVGKMVLRWSMDHLMSGPVVAVIIEGVHAIPMVRKIVGKTYPSVADMGTIRGDYSVDSPVLANNAHRSVRNLVHASGDATEAKNEIALWFKEGEIHDYDRAEEDLMF